MAFEQLEYTKSWERAADFPTFEQDETRVRADMQFLYNEIKNFINSKLVDVLNTDGAGNVQTASGKSIAAVLDELQAGISNLSGGVIPDEGTGIAWDLNMDGHKLTNVGDPTDEGDAVNKGYLENAVSEAVKSSANYVLSVGSSAPADTKMLWMDTSAKALKYYDGTAWAPVTTVDTSKIEASIATLQLSVSSLSTEITTVKGTVSTHTTQIANLQSSVTALGNASPSYGTTDLVAGSSSLAEGKVHYVYE